MCPVNPFDKSVVCEVAWLVSTSSLKIAGLKVAGNDSSLVDFYLSKTNHQGQNYSTPKKLLVVSGNCKVTATDRIL